MKHITVYIKSDITSSLLTGAFLMFCVLSNEPFSPPQIPTSDEHCSKVVFLKLCETAAR